MTDDKVVPIFGLPKELEDLPHDEALAICRMCIATLQAEVQRLSAYEKMHTEL